MKQFDVILTCNYSPWSRYSGGGQKSTHQIATALANKGLSICVVYSKSPWEQVATPKDLPYSIKWAFFFALRPCISSPLRFLNGISFYVTVRKICGAHTIVHSNGDEGGLLGFLPEKKKFIYTNRYPNFDSFLFHTDWKRAINWIRVFMREPRFAVMALAIRKADAVTCTSAFSLSQVKKCFGTAVKNLREIKNGIDPFFLGGTYTYKNQKGLLYFGRLTHAKGIDVLLRAFCQLPAQLRKDQSVRIIGEGPYRKPLESLVSELGLDGQVLFEGWLDRRELVERILSHRVTVLPSREESFGNTMLEVLGLGAPLITTTAGSIPEITGPWGHKVPPDNVDQLSAAIRDELENIPSRERISQQISFVKSLYSWENAAEQFMELYTEGNAQKPQAVKNRV
ncbi:glycosyltransferase family 4 protein [Fibrobacterota bacterium]